MSGNEDKDETEQQTQTSIPPTPVVEGTADVNAEVTTEKTTEENEGQETLVADEIKVETTDESKNEEEGDRVEGETEEKQDATQQDTTVPTEDEKVDSEEKEENIEVKEENIVEGQVKVDEDAKPATAPPSDNEGYIAPPGVEEDGIKEGEVPNQGDAEMMAGKNEGMQEVNVACFRRMNEIC
ncbi:uncharacterized protein LOC144751250 [Ciona intestinalis]